MKSDQDQRGSIPYSTSSRDMPPPLVTTDFTVIDEGAYVCLLYTGMCVICMCVCVYASLCVCVFLSMSMIRSG